MSKVVLNEHDANQGAQSKGEFLGMTGNSAWYLLGSAGATVLMVIVLWGVFEIPLLLCMLVGLVLCLLSVAYVFTLKNNKPAHYDTDFFESALVEAGMMELAFGPREKTRRPPNPFSNDYSDDEFRNDSTRRSKMPDRVSTRSSGRNSSRDAITPDTASKSEEAARNKKSRTDEPEPTVPLWTYEKLQSELELTQEQLADVLAQNEEF